MSNHINNKMMLTAKLDQKLAMNPQLRQAITLLQYNTLDLRQYIQQYMEKNLFLDVEENDASNQIESDADDDVDSSSFQGETQFNQKSSNHFNHSDRFSQNENYLENYAVPKNLRDYLKDQTLLCKFNPIEQHIAEAIIDAIDDEGYLTMSLVDIQHALEVLGPPSIDTIESVLSFIRTFDPIGVGAKDVKECLTLQLENLPIKNQIWQTAKEIINKYFEKVSFTETKKIMSELNITKEQFEQAKSLISLLDPKPGLKYSSDMDINIEPDLYVKKVKNTWQVFLANNILTSIKINDQYQSLIKKNKEHESYEILNKELQEAQWLLKGLKRRNETLLKVASYIMHLQKDFLEHGPSSMKPMNILDVSQALDLHESTVSRVTTGKYIATPQGFFELKYFFPSHVGTQSGESCSNTAVKQYIKEIIQAEKDHIYSDGEIAKILKQKGINVARRTVAKYREALKILPSNQRSKVNN